MRHRLSSTVGRPERPHQRQEARNPGLSWTQASVKTEELLSGLHHGYAPLADVTRERALCVLRGKKVAILGDSITRYFAYTLNYFLKFGEVPPEYDWALPFED